MKLYIIGGADETYVVGEFGKCPGVDYRKQAPLGRGLVS